VKFLDSFPERRFMKVFKQSEAIKNIETSRGGFSGIMIASFMQ